jgi:single-strand DNA-binding protein
MTGVNKVILVGNLGAKPELKYTATGVAMCKFSIATTENWGVGEDGERRQHTEWHNITAWRKLGEICCEYLDKGTKVYIEGSIRTRTFTGNDGVKKWYTDIQADQMVILTPKGVREQAPEYPEEVPAEPGEQEGGKGTSESGSGDELPDTLNLDEDVDFF